MARILVAYATKKGSTTEIANAIARELGTMGHSADAVGIAQGASPRGCDAVVLGGPIYMGRIEGSVGKFVQRYAAELARMQVAAFVVGLAAASKDAEGMAWSEKALRSAIAPLTAVSIGIFAGRLDPAQLSWFQRLITRKVHAPVGDFRDWAAIAAWARGLPGAMRL